VSSKQLISEEELLNLYKSGIRDFTAYEINFVVPGAMNLSGVDFRGQYLAECDFSGSNFSGANLQGVDFAQSDLSDVDLTGADLTGASLIETFFTGTNFTDANLSNTFFSPNQMQRCNFTRANFSGSEWGHYMEAEGNIYHETVMPDGTLKTATE
jgi:uncharacterized protein YjbI with pentapeptide repeats